MFDQSTQYPYNNNYFRGEYEPSHNSPSSGRKDPYQVLGIPHNASLPEIKSAYRRLAMTNHPDRVQGNEAKKKEATAKFAEISAAYELLTAKSNGGDDVTGSATASHPSFAGGTGAGARAEPAADGRQYYDYTYRPTSYPHYDTFRHGGFGQQPHQPSFMDPFGFGTFGAFEFTDPFELFRRTFGNNDMMFGSSFPATNPFMQQGMGMNNSGFGGFSSMFVNGGQFLPTSGYTTTSYSSTSYNGDGGGAMVSTTTTMVNGKTVTRTEKTVVNPDGTTSTVVDLTGDDDVEDNYIPAIQADVRRKSRERHDGNSNLIGQLQDTAATPRKKAKQQRAKNAHNSTATQSPPNGHYQFKSSEHVQDSPSKKLKSKQSKKNISKSKEKLQQNQSKQPSSAAVPSNKDLLKPNLSDTELKVGNLKSSGQAKNSNESTGSTKKQNDIHVPQQQRANRKRKFCDIMYRCMICCFPPCKRRRVASI